MGAAEKGSHEMRVKRRCIITGRMNEMELPITEEQVERWKRGVVVQKAFPQLTADQREFLISGMLPETWDAVVPREDDLDVLPEDDGAAYLDREEAAF